MRDLIAKGRFFCNHQTRRRRRHIVDNSMQAKAKPEAQLGDRRSHRKEPRRVGCGNSKKFAKFLTITEIREICVSKTGTSHFGLAYRHPTHYLCRRVPLHIDKIKYPGSQKISPASTNRAPTVFQVFRVFRVFQVFQFRFWNKKTPIFGPNRNKTGVSRVPPKRDTPNQACFRSAKFTHSSPLFFY